MQVHQLMTKKVRALAPDDGLAAAFHLLLATGGRHLVVLEDERLVGIVSELDVLRAWARQNARISTVRQVMSGNVHTASPSETLLEIATRFIEERVGCFPVVEGERIVGMVDVDDVISAVAREHFPRPGAAKNAKKKKRSSAAKRPRRR